MTGSCYERAYYLSCCYCVCADDYLISCVVVFCYIVGCFVSREDPFSRVILNFLVANYCLLLLVIFTVVIPMLVD